MFVSVCVLSCVCILSLMAPSVALSGNSTKPSAGKIQIKPYSNSRKFFLKKIPFDCLWKERKFWSRNISTVETGGKAVKSPKEVEKQTLHGHERVTQTLAQ